MSDQQHHFGRFVLQPAKRQLLIDDQPAALGARAFDLLLALAEHRDRMVSKNELLDLVWPGLVVEENNLQVHVSALRKLLGPQAIATIPGRGYRFTLAATGGAEHPLSSGPLPGTQPADGTARSAPHELAVPLVGRDADLAALLALLDTQALVTLVGAGGMGKTALARAAAQARHGTWAEGVAWVELASLDDDTLVAGAVAQSLALQLTPGSDALAALVSALKPMRLLLVLDNAEHLLDGAAHVVQALLQGAPGVRILVTSQVPLRLAHEQVQRLAALAVPDPASSFDEALNHGAVRLFAERARQADRRFELSEANVRPVIDICRRLDGMPLALELAAARVPLLGVQGVASRLDDRFKLLANGTRGAPTRQQTLQAALDWSLALLRAEERELFQQLGVFAGGFTLELARAVFAHEGGLDEWALIDTLATLADRSLLNVSPAEPPRYALSDTARAHALAQLRSSPEYEPLRGRHAQALRKLFEASPSDWLQMSDRQWLGRYAGELDNLRAALLWAQANDAQTLVALVGAAAPLWHHLSLHGEARRWHTLSEPLLDASTPKPLAAQWWRAAQWVWADVSPERSRAAAERTHALYRELGDEHGLYAQLSGLAGLWQEPSPQARAALDEALSLEQAHWPARERAWGQRARADVARAEGRLADSRAAREAELALRHAAGDERGQLRAMSHLADLALAMGEVDEAVRRGYDLLGRLRSQRSPSTLCVALLNLMHALLVQGDAARASALAPEASALAHEFGLLWLAADDLALLAAQRGRIDTAALLIGWSDAAHEARGGTRQGSRAQARQQAETQVTAALQSHVAQQLIHAGAGLSETGVLRALAG